MGLFDKVFKNGGNDTVDKENPAEISTAEDYGSFSDSYDTSQFKKLRIFIAYDENDYDVAREICDLFESNNIRCWLKDRDLDGQNQANTILNRISDASLIVFVSSKHSNNSNFVCSEIDIAFSSQIPIIVFKIDESDFALVDFFVSRKHQIQAFSNHSQKFKQLFDDSLRLSGINPAVIPDSPKQDSDESSYLKRPFKAYSGDKPFIFISYAHKDAKLVFRDIKRFHDEGYPVWYDQGLTPGQEWDDEIARALMRCSLLVVFISKNSMASKNVQDEIKMALNRDIDVVPIYLEETELPPSLELRLSNKHAIMKYLATDSDYIYECFKAFKKANI